MNNQIKVDTEKAMLETRIRLMKEQPFYAALLSRCVVYFTDKVQTAAAGVTKDGAMNLIFNAGFFMSLHPNHRLGIMIHEILHLVLRHTERFRKEDKIDSHMANIACDMALNQYIQRSLLPDDGIFPEKYGLQTGKSSEWYYSELLKRKEEPEKREPENDSSQEDSSGEGGSGEGEAGESESKANASGQGRPERMDDHDFDISSVVGKEAASDEEAQSVIGNSVEEAYSDSRDSTPGSESVVVEKVVEMNRQSRERVIRWQDVLKRYVGRELESRNLESTRTRVNRRLGLKASGKKKSDSPKVMVAVDNSGSVDEGLFSRLTQEIENILTKFDGELTVFHFDTTVLKTETLKRKPSKHVRHGRGGTDFSMAFEYAKENGADLVVFLTDGEDSLKVKGRRPSVVWVIPKSMMSQDHLVKTGRVVCI